VNDPLIGQTVAGRYVVVERIGEGGMGFVYKARQEPIGRMVALKILLPDKMGEDRAVARFLNEARIISQLRHHNTVKLIDFGQLSDKRLFIAMEYLDGGTLAALMAGKRLAAHAALRIARQICKSLAEAHALGIIHRDLKPENVLLDEMHGEEIHARVVDFGLAKLPAQSGSMRDLEVSRFGRMVETVPGVRLGTPAYMSPEQAFARPVDARSDLYAVGVLLYRMLTGHLPFDGDNTTGIALAHLHDAPEPMDEVAPEAQVDPQIEALVMALLAKDPEDRPTSAASVLRRLDTFIDHQAQKSGGTPSAVVLPAAPRPPRPVDTVVLPARRRFIVLAFSAGTALGFTLAILLR
jgi:serine/threonine protein kinase